MHSAPSAVKQALVRMAVSSYDSRMAQELSDNQQARHSKREDEILRAALELFFERGFRAVGLRDLTEALNLNVATLYHYFKSKDQILFRLQQDGMVRLLQGAQLVSE